jgi:hypothetical protein
VDSKRKVTTQVEKIKTDEMANSTKEPIPWNTKTASLGRPILNGNNLVVPLAEQISTQRSNKNELS